MVRRSLNGWRSAAAASGFSAAIALLIIASSRSPAPSDLLARSDRLARSDLLAQISDESGIPTLRVGGRGRKLKTSLVDLLGRLHATRRGNGSGEATRRGKGSGEHGAASSRGQGSGKKGVTKMGTLAFEKYAYENHQVIDSGLVGLSGWGTARAEDAQGTPTQSHISPSILVYED